ncbi:hypothetical protein Halru_2821 [Halovivax ruber XH-70]|uniref:DNA recombination and repair protein Rad51-like C-terminal domain-containing protein n=1 Tax=Halovivax ruber (strain DSM 18193 / JCM 13892 / XH-70) TaxID=797302 RepID=L0IHF0_HALRX|nr:hypothetical protein [Halovivax ruber]AGB17392.1 hypothetical protein Halru_2821 [Halovivax ruber XH-70]
MHRFDKPAIPELPDLEPGITLLKADDPITPLHSLVVDHVLIDGGNGYWVDSHGHGRTDTLTDVSPSDRILDRIEVARGFTPQQHHELVATLSKRRIDPSLIVAPAVDGQYRDDSLRSGEATNLLLRTLARLARLARDHECPVLVTRARDDALSEPVSEIASHTVSCRSTPLGPRFEGEDFETLVYPQEDGWVQTTLAFWAEVLRAREPLYADAPTEVQIHGAH